MKILLILIVLFSSGSAVAECTAEQESTEIDIKVIRGPRTVEAGGNHGMMDRIGINAPAEVAGIPITAMELTKGEVAEFWIPLAFKTNNGRATTEITGYQFAIKHFEVAIYYENDNCKKSIQRML